MSAKLRAPKFHVGDAIELSPVGERIAKAIPRRFGMVMKTEPERGTLTVMFPGVEGNWVSREIFWQKRAVANLSQEA